MFAGSDMSPAAPEECKQTQRYVKQYWVAHKQHISKNLADISKGNR
jgi:hypothetical protein